MKYALNLDTDGRILSVTFEKYAPKDTVLVEELPDGNAVDYRYVEAEYVYDPIPATEVEESFTTLEERVGELEEALDMLLSGVTE